MMPAEIAAAAVAETSAAASWPRLQPPMAAAAAARPGDGLTWERTRIGHRVRRATRADRH